MKNIAIGLSIIIVAVSVMACARAQGHSPAQKRQYTLDMKADTLNELYRRKPETRSLVQNAAGYGVFSNINAQLLWFGTGNGYGVVTDNRTGKARRPI